MASGRNHSRWVVRVLAVLAVGVLLGVPTLSGATSTVAQEGTPNLEAQQGALDGGEGVAPLEVDAGPEAVLGKVIVLPAAAFVHDGSASESYVMSRSGGFLKCAEALACGMLAPVILPAGATRIKGLRVYAHDDNGHWSAIFCLNRITLSTGNAESLGCVSTSQSAGVEAYKIVPSKMYVSSDRAYQIVLSLVSDVYVYGVKVGYQ